MDIQGKDDYTLRNLNKVNVILGKNGCGKSTLLRAFGSHGGTIANAGNVSYITPERSGSLMYEPNVEQTVTAEPQSVRDQRSRNQLGQFKQQTAAQFRKLKDLVRSEIEQHIKESRPGRPELFDDTVQKLNTLLDEIRIVLEEPAFRFKKKGTEDQISPQNISSGESELVALGIESLVFVKEIQAGRVNLLLLDEPDVHLHPDLQVRLMHFIRDLVEANDFHIIIASHSTALLGALENYAHVSVGFMKAADKTISFEPINEIYRKILPVFGAHPLSNIFSETPILLVEGEDDERIWQQTVRSSNGAIKTYPCVCGSVDQINKYEEDVTKIIESVYDNANAYSLRDGDGELGDLDDSPPLTKLRLQSYAAENLLLTDEVLESLNTDWEKLKVDVKNWIVEKTASGHPHLENMKAFCDGGFDRRNRKIKELRNDIMGIIGSEKPWEIAIGQMIANLQYTDTTDFDLEGSLFTFLGEKVTKNLLTSEQQKCGRFRSTNV